MANYLKNGAKAYGYARVSTDLQQQKNDGIERQSASIRQAAISCGWQLLGIEEDIGTATGTDSLHHRPGLHAVFVAAQREGAAVIVTDPTRLFRNKRFGLNVLRRFGVTVFSIKNGRVLSLKDLGEAFQAGDEFAQNVRIGSSKHSSGRAKSSEHLKQATKQSGKARARKSEEIADAIADVFDTDPCSKSLTHAELAKLLNSRGLRSGWGREWTATTIRDRRKRATELHALRIAADTEDDVFSAVSAPVLATQWPTTHSFVATDENRLVEDETSVEATVDDYTKNPLFGLF